MRFLCLLATLCVIFAGPSHAAPSAPGADPALTVRAFLDQHCMKCHSGEKPKGDLTLDKLRSDFNDASNRTLWSHVLEKIDSGEMPPKAKPRPPVADVRATTGWITARVKEANDKLRAIEGRVVLRRVNRHEYENTLRDLLGVQVSVKDLLPLDSSAEGFDNVGDALHTSSFLLARYLEAAEEALNQAIANRPQPQINTKRVTLNDAHQVRSSKEGVFRKSSDGRVVMFSSSRWVAGTLFYAQERGRYRFRISVSAIQSAGKPVTFSVVSGGGGMGGPRGHLVGYFDAPADKPTVIEFEDQMEPKTSITILPYGLATAQTVSKVGAESWSDAGLAVDWAEMEGPLNESWPPPSHQRLFGDLKQGLAPTRNQSNRVEVISDAPEADARRILTAFARRAFRRPVVEKEIAPFVALVMKRMSQESTFEQAVRAGLAGILTSPEFIFLRETPGKLSDFALASRLSYFLWSSMPDDELLAKAEAGKLGDASVLREQVERMLRSPKHSAFTTNFLGQWLSLRDIDFTEPSHRIYPEFDDMLKASMLRETELFFEELLMHDHSITNFLASDFTMLNGRLARHYGIPDVHGWEFQKVALPASSHRGGVLTMASVLKITANGTSTSPVMRGAWVLDRILGTPPKPPPPDAGTIEPDIRGATTMREQLAKHRTIESCASCHVKIDPPGFALESFDVIGGWREHYRVTGGGKPVTLDGRRMSYSQGQAVDAADVMPDGRRFTNIDEFKKLLLESKDQFARSLTTKLLIYATGGVVGAADQAEVAAIVEKTIPRNMGFRSLVHEVVQSNLFRSK
jgi:hypothetical protein